MAYRNSTNKYPTIHDPLRSPSHERDPRKRNTPMSRVLRAAPLILNERGNILTSTETDKLQGRPPDQNPHSTQKSEPLREKGEPLARTPYKHSGGSSGFSPPGPAFNLQREYLSVVTVGGGPLGGSWSGLPWLSYTSSGRKPKNMVSHLFAPKS